MLIYEWIKGQNSVTRKIERETYNPAGLQTLAILTSLSSLPTLLEVHNSDKVL